jgi:hypothetical protein
VTEKYRLLGCTQRASVAFTVNVVPSSLLLVTLMMEAIRSSETSALTRATLRNIPEEGILQNALNLHSFISVYFPEISYRSTNQDVEMVNITQAGKFIFSN